MLDSRLHHYFYEFQADEQNPDGGFEWSIMLDRLPESGVFSFPVDFGGLKVYYQPPLIEELAPREYDSVTPTEAWKDGKLVVYRPENVVGSCAVYDAAGRKVFHIYRPLLVDAKGETCWAELKIADGLLTLILPLDWLGKAAYPVVVDPTFGYTTVGGSDGYGWNNQKQARRFQMPVDGEITSIEVYTQRGAVGDVLRAGIYSDTSDAPNALLVTGSEVAVPASYDWAMSTLSYNGVGGAWYWFSFIISASSYINYKYDAGAPANSANYNSDTYSDGFADPWGKNNYYADYLSIRINYTASSGGTGQQLFTLINLMGY
ncbi:MAG: hypothetical protein ACQCN6_01655 [Candidatus Bathyarchaeia archaeon]